MPSNVEAARLRFRPESVRVLFVGESAPAGGTFFYTMDSLLYDATQRAFREAIPDLLTEQNFLRSFQALGCYLVDLCDQPVNKLPRQVRLWHRDDGIEPLSGMIAETCPRALINVMASISSWIDRATVMAEVSPEVRLDFPFPTRQQEPDYVDELAQALRDLRQLGILAGRHDRRAP
jgi:hypothetical protein